MDKTIEALTRWVKANKAIEVPCIVEEDEWSWGLLSLIPLMAVGAGTANNALLHAYCPTMSFLRVVTGTVGVSILGGLFGLYSGYQLYTTFPGRFVRKVRREINPILLYIEAGILRCSFYKHEQIETVKDLVAIPGMNIDLLLKQIDAVESQKVLEARRAEVAAQKLEERLFEVSEAILAKVGES